VPNNMGQTAGMTDRNTTTGYTVTFKCLFPRLPPLNGHAADMPKSTQMTVRPEGANYQ
jgi:hypothetical protein